jgi:dihydrofolate reductase
MISIIIAIAKNGVIGKGGDLPWKLSDDLKHFARVTRNHKVIMGRKTYESIIKRLGHGLPERENIVITSQSDFNAPGCVVFTSVDEVIKKFSNNEEEVFVIGGAEIYKQFLPKTNKLYITQVSADCEGDTYFHVNTEKDWKIVSSEQHLKDEKNSYDFVFQEFVRNQ